MIDFRLALAQEVADQIGAEIQMDRCVKCRMPLLEKAEQGMPFCWFCVTDRMAASRGRTALTKARLASKGIFIHDDVHMHPVFAHDNERVSAQVNPRNPNRIVDTEKSGVIWPEGMAL